MISPSSSDNEQTSGLELRHFLPTTAQVDRVPVLSEPIEPYATPVRNDRRWGWIAMGVMVVGACLATLIVTMQSPNEEVEEVTPSPSYYNSLERLMYQASRDDPLLPDLMWNDPMSPQYLALEWMAYRDDEYFLKSAETDNLSMLLPQIQQRFALITLFYAAGLQWYDQWLRAGVSECEFVGIGCNDEDQVTFIDLKRGAMTGTLPHELGWFTHLTQLDLHDNRLRGSIPPGLLQLPELLQLDLSANHLDGVVATLPPKLEVVNLEHNLFKGSLPDWPVSLQMAKLAYNRWEGNLPSFPQENELLYLDVVDSNIDGALPTSIGYLTKLKSLSVYQTQLNGTLPTEVGLLKDLEELSIGMTQMNGTLPEELWEATSLEWLVAVQHRFHGPISTRIGNLQQLRVLNMLNGHFTGSLPTTLGSLPNLVWLQLAVNKLTGTIPPELTSASNLRKKKLTVLL